MVDDIEHLKQNKIGLPTVEEDPEPSAEESEAYGGSGEKPDGPIDPEVVRERIVDALRTVYDPEIPVNIYELGLIYGLDIQQDGRVEVRMTLTAPACPVAGQLVKEVADKVGEVDGVSVSHVELVWEPPWTPDRMTEEAKLELGML